MCEHGEPRGARYCAFCRRAGIRGKEDGQLRAAEAVDPGWWSAASTQVHFLAASGEPFTVEDVIAKVGLPNAIEINANNSVGALISRLARKGVIEGIGYTKASRAESHSRAIRLWKGRVLA